MGWLSYLAILAPCCFVLTCNEGFIIDTGSDLYKKATFRYNVYTSKISVGNFIYYCVVHLVGWVFIRRVNQRDM